MTSSPAPSRAGSGRVRRCHVAAWCLFAGTLGCRTSADPPARSEDATPAEVAPGVAEDRSVAPPEPVGPLVAVQTLDHDRHRAVLVSAHGGVEPLLPHPAPPDAMAEGSTYPVAVFPDHRRVLVLHAAPGEGARSRDRLGVVELGANGSSNVTWFGPTGASIRHPRLDPAGRFVVYESDADSFRDLYRVRVGSDEAQRLTDDEEGNFEPFPSPDGEQVVFVSSRDGNPEIYRLGVRGGRAVRLTDEPASDTAPVWSPDGGTIAFVSTRLAERGADVYLMRPDGGQPRPLINEPAADRGAVTARQLTFSPEGDRLAFTEQRAEADVRVVVVDTATGEVVARTAGVAADEWPAWKSGNELVLSRGAGAQRSQLAWFRVADGRTGDVVTDDGHILWMPHPLDHD